MKNTCSICNNNKTNGFTTFTAELGFGVVVVRNVPAKICVKCGEEWIEHHVSISLEKIVDNAKSNHSIVEVLAYA